MAATREAYLDVQQMCDYVLLKHVNVTKEAETEKLYKKWTKLWVVVHSEVSPLDCFLGYCKKENKWLQDNQAIVKYSLNDFTVSLVSTKKHDKVVRLEFPSISMELCFDSQTKLDHYYQLLLGVTKRHHVDLVRAPSHPEREGDYIIEDCSDSYKVWKAMGDHRGRLCFQWHLRTIRRIHYHRNVEKLEVEAGRSSETGEGHFYFTGRHAYRLFEAMKAELVRRAQQKQHSQNRSLPSSYESVQPNLSQSNFAHTSSDPHVASTSSQPTSPQPLQKPLGGHSSSTNGIFPARSTAASDETSSEEYSPSDNSSSYTGGSIQDWTTCTSSPFSGSSLERPVPPIPPRAQDIRPFSPSSTSSSSSSSTSGYNVHRRHLLVPPTNPQYMRVNHAQMDEDNDYMTMTQGLKRVQLTHTPEDDDDSGYTDMQSAGGAPLYSTPSNVPVEYMDQYMRMVPNLDCQTATLTRNRSDPLTDPMSTPPFHISNVRSPLVEFNIFEPNDPNKSNTFPGSQKI